MPVTYTTNKLNHRLAMFRGVLKQSGSSKVFYHFVPAEGTYVPLRYAAATIKGQSKAMNYL